MKTNSGIQQAVSGRVKINFEDTFCVVSKGSGEIKNMFSEKENCFSEIKNQLSEIKNCFSEIENQLLEIKNQLLEIKNQLLKIKNQLSETKNQLLKIKNCFSEIKNQLLISKNIACISNAIQKQGFAPQSVSRKGLQYILTFKN